MIYVKLHHHKRSYKMILLTRCRIFFVNFFSNILPILLRKLKTIPPDIKTLMNYWLNHTNEAFTDKITFKFYNKKITYSFLLHIYFYPLNIDLKLGLFNMAKPNRTEPNRTEIDNMVWIWYIPYKPNGYDF